MAAFQFGLFVSFVCCSLCVISQSPFYILNPANFSSLLQEDLPWAETNIPLFESSDANMTATYYFRWRTYRRHTTRPADTGSPYEWFVHRKFSLCMRVFFLQRLALRLRLNDHRLTCRVVTEFAPNVPWAGRDNTIPCAAGHHIQDGRWLRDQAVMDSYTAWWASGLPGIKQNYYYWYATALLRRLQVAGSTNLPLVARLLPNVTALYWRYAAGDLPANAAWDAANNCLWNVPGNEGQENTASGPGCRPLVNSLMCGEAQALSALYGAVGDTAMAATFAGEAERWRATVLRMWNANISAFATLQSPQPAPPAPPVPPMPPGYALFTNASIFCCDQTPCQGGHSKHVWEGLVANATACALLCSAVPAGRCHYVTVTAEQPTWCILSEYCNTTNPYAGDTAFTFARHTQVHEPKTRDHQSASPPPLFNYHELASLSSPWFFGVVPEANATLYSASWAAAMDPAILAGPLGLRTLEPRAPQYTCAQMGCCRWDGPTWPFETSKALRAMVDILQSPSLSAAVPLVSRSRLWDLLGQYTAMHTPGVWLIANSSTGKPANYSDLQARGLFLTGLGTSWIAEAGCGDSGVWTDDPLEGYWYNHAHYMDLLLGTVAGLVPEAHAAPPRVTIQPLQPTDTTLQYWAVDGAQVAGRIVSVLWDATGLHYGRGQGLRVYVDGVLAGHADTLQGQSLVVNL